MASKPQKDDSVNISIPKVEAPAGWGSIGERFLYRMGPPDGEGGIVEAPGIAQNRAGERVLHCGAVPIQGYVFDRYDYMSEAIGREFSMLAIKLTQPCVGIQDDRHVAMVPGQVLVVTETYELASFASPAKHPTHTVEIWIKPKGVRAIPGRPGQMVKLWDRRSNFKPLLREPLALPTMAFFDGADPFAIKMLESSATKQLPENASASS